MKKIATALIALIAVLALYPVLALGGQEQAETSLNLTTQASSASPDSGSGIALTTQDEDPLDDGGVYAIYSALTNKTLSLEVADASKSSGANVRIYEANKTIGQYWVAKKVGDGCYRFLTLNGSNALSVKGTAKSGANVCVLKATSSKATVWYVKKNSNGTLTISPNGYGGLALDIAGASATSGTNAQVYAKNGTKAQRFKFVKANALTAAFANGKTVSNRNVVIESTLGAGFAVDVAGDSLESGANIQLYTINNTVAQRFTIAYAGKGLYTIKGVGSDKYVEVAGNAAKSGSNVQQCEQGRALGQYWYIVKNGNGYQILSARSGLALDVAGGAAVDGANIRVAKDKAAARQTFKFTTVPTVANGAYVIQSAIIDPMVVDVANSSKKAGANVQTARSTGSSSQQWNIKYVGSGAYTIMNVKSGKYLTVSKSSTASAANVIQATYTGTQAQKWKIKSSSGGFVITNANSKKVLDVNGASKFSGANVQQYDSNETLAQRFKLKSGDWSFYAGASKSAKKYIAKAEEYEGWPYHWGGRSPQTSFDCSGLVMYCANQVLGKNYDLVNTNASILSTMCTRISASKARPGDLVFYKGTYGSLDHISHVVIYCGDGIMYGAGSPIGYDRVDVIKNMAGQPAEYFYARMK